MRWKSKVGVIFSSCKLVRHEDQISIPKAEGGRKRNVLLESMVMEFLGALLIFQNELA